MKRTAEQLLLRKASAEALAWPAMISLSSWCDCWYVGCHRLSGFVAWLGATLTREAVGRTKQGGKCGEAREGRFSGQETGFDV